MVITRLFLFEHKLPYMFHKLFMNFSCMGVNDIFEKFVVNSWELYV